jgi:hypothetical protein
VVGLSGLLDWVAVNVLVVDLHRVGQGHVFHATHANAGMRGEGGRGRAGEGVGGDDFVEGWFVFVFLLLLRHDRVDN